MSTEGVVTAATAATELVDESALDVQVPTSIDEVVVLDYGGQYSQLIARRVRECGFFSELLPHNVGAEEVARRKPKGLILSGGPASVYADGARKLDKELLELGIPVLGICYGMQAMAAALGGDVARTGGAEFGKTELDIRGGVLLHDVGEVDSCWMSHNDAVEDASGVNPGGASKTVSRCDIQHDWSAGSPSNSRPCSRTVSCDRPNSPTSAPSTLPPSLSASSCMP